MTKLTRTEITEQIAEQMGGLPLLIAQKFSEDIERLIAAEYERAMDDVAANINHLIEQGHGNEWQAPYCAALYDMQKRLGFKGTSRELLS